MNTMKLHRLLILLALTTASSCLFAGAEDEVDQDPCEGYCARMEENCPTAFAEQLGDDTSTCLQTCRDYPNDPELEDDAEQAPADDTLECRLFHSTLAAEAPEPDNKHCGHSSPDGTDTCTKFRGPCFEYCEIVVEEICLEEENAFQSLDDCAEACGELRVGDEGDESGNTSQCLFTYAQRALDDDDPSICPDALPGSPSCQ